MKAKILLGVSGGIAAYKAVELASQLAQRDYQVSTVMTASAQAFVGKPSFAAVTNQPVYSELFESPDKILHIELARQHDLILIVPATADLMAKMSLGLADDLLSNLLLANTQKTMLAPSMNTQMYLNPATQSHLETLRQRGIQILEPESGHLACHTEGVGRLADLQRIIDEVESFFNHKQSLKHKNILITSGSVYSKIDPVRVLSNRSSGKMGKAFERAFLNLGAKTQLLEGGEFHAFKNQLMQLAEDADWIVMAAAVTDFELTKPWDMKIKQKTEVNFSFQATQDLLATLGKQKKKNQRLIGFALEQDWDEASAMKKMKDKNCDVILLNRFENLEADHAKIRYIDAQGRRLDYGPASKNEIAEQIVAELCRNFDS